MTFVIQSKMIGDYEIPAQDFGYAVIEAIGYSTWYSQAKVYDFVLLDDLSKFDVMNVYLRGLVNYIPVGSVEFCLQFYSKFQYNNIKPLNIPIELWDFVKRDVCIDYCRNINGHWFLKSTSQIKSEDNGEVWFNGDSGEDEQYFLTKYIEDIVSEWRLFIYNKKILGVKCYSGDEWILPDKEYCQRIVNFYDKTSYTLDVLVRKNGITDILELHDFFACGLYGFSHYNLLDMMIATHRGILGIGG